MDTWARSHRYKFRELRLEATVETALRREDLRGEFLDYLMKVVEQEKALKEAALSEE